MPPLANPYGAVVEVQCGLASVAQLRLASVVEPVHLTAPLAAVVLG
jgi:hypothetical protein